MSGVFYDNSICFMSIPNKKYIFLFIPFVLLIIFLLVLFLYLIDDGGAIYNVEITNVTSNSFVISWQTKKKVVSKVIVGKNDNLFPVLAQYTSGSKIYFDQGDAEDEDVDDEKLVNPKSRNFHYVNVTGLDPETKYHIRILGDIKSFAPEYKDSVKTFSIVQDLSTPKPFYSRALNYSDGDKFAEEGFLRFYLQDESGKKSQLMSSLINPKNGGWNSDLANIRLEDGTEFTWEFSEKVNLNLEIFTSEGEGSGYGNLGSGNVLQNFFYNVRYIPKQQL